MRLSLLVLSLLYLVDSQDVPSCPQRDNSTLRFLFMTSFGSAFNSSGSVVGMMMALERINANSTILADYTLEYSDIVDSQCERTVSLTGFFDEIKAECRDFISVIGAGCSVATAPVASVGHFYGLSQISYGASADILATRQLYRNHFQMYTRESTYLPAIADMIAYYGWSQLGIVTQNEELFTESLPILREYFKELNITLLPTARLNSDENPADLQDIFAENARVYYLNTYEDKARQVICSAYHKGFYGNNYQWIVFGWYNDKWWQISDDRSPFDCTSEQLYEVLVGSFAIQQFPINELEDKVVVGDWSYNQFREAYLKRLPQTGYTDTIAAHIAHDAVWALAFALDKVIEQINNNYSGNCSGEITALTDWDYTNSTTACLIRSALADTNFEGLTGHVAFNKNGTRLNNIVRIYQLRNGSLVQVAKWSGNFAYIHDENNNTIFPAGVPPDGRPVEIVLKFHTPLTVTMYVLAVVGIVFATVCIAFMVIFRTKKIIIVTSTSVDIIIIIGAVMIFLSVFVRVYPYDTAVSATVCCNIVAVIGNIGCALTFAAVLAKMWRIYYIFHNPSITKKNLTSVHLIATCTLIAAGMAIILVIGLAIPATRPSGNKVEDAEHPPTLDECGILQVFYVYRCYSNTASIVWQVTIYVYYGILQVIALFLAVQTRKVNKTIHDSKEVLAIIYITSTLMVVMVISFVLHSYHNIQEAILTGSLTTVGLVVLSFMFIPKMWRLYSDPNGDKLNTTVNRSTGGAADVHSKLDSMAPADTDKEKIAALQAQIDNLTELLKKNT